MNYNVIPCICFWNVKHIKIIIKYYLNSMPSFGIELKKLRRSLQMDQQELADLLGVSRVTVSNWETGTHKPSKQYILEIKKIFNVKNIMTQKSENFENDPEKFILPDDATVAPAEKRQLPVIGLAEAGPGLFTDPDFRDPEETASCPTGLHDPQAFWVPITGESMRPYLIPGMRVCISPNLECKSGGRSLVGLRDGQRLIAEIHFDKSEVKLIKYNTDSFVVQKDELDFCYPIVYVREPR